MEIEETSHSYSTVALYHVPPRLGGEHNNISSSATQETNPALGPSGGPSFPPLSPAHTRNSRINHEKVCGLPKEAEKSGGRGHDSRVVTVC